MITTLQNNTSTIPYWNSIRSLSNHDKLRLISLLSASLVDTETFEARPSAHDFYGIWQEDSYKCEELISDIKDCRRFKDDIVEL